MIGGLRIEGRRTLVAALGVAALLAFVVQESWAGRPITGDSLLFFLVVGVTLGSIYAIAATGLVVTYTTSGVFNFAQGAIGMFMAFVYWELHSNPDGPQLQTMVALLITVGVAAPITGALIERILMRRLANASLVAQLVVTIGLMFFLIGLANLLWEAQESRTIGTFFGTDGFQVGQTFVPWFRFITIVAGLVLAVLLRVVLYRTRIGVAMRAVVDNRDLASLSGARPARVSMFAWALGSAMAALAGIFLAEELANLGVSSLTLFVVDAFAAAIIGRLRSLPLTYAGGMLIGLSLSFQQNFLTWGERWTAAPAAIPTILLFLALVFLPQARIEGRRVAAVVTPRVPSMKRAALGMTALLIVVLPLAAALGRTDVRRLTLALVTAFIMLSLVPLTGWAGQISLAQITFAGIGAFTMVEVAGGSGNPLGLLAAAAVAVPIGALVALPALRLQGLYLALATMAFARMAEFLFFSQPEVFGTGTARRVSGIEIFGLNFNEGFSFLGIDFGADSAFLLLVTVLFGAVGLGVVGLRRGSFGRRLVAMRDSPAACATLGINLLATKLAVFALSAAIAAVGGALLGAHLGVVATQDFLMLGGIPYLLLLVVGGVAVVSGALLGGLFLQSFTWLTLIFPGVTVVNWLRRLGPGLAGIGIGHNPEGLVPQIGHDARARRANTRTKGNTRDH